MAYNIVLGRLNYRVTELHEKYGSVVRVGPNELSFIDEDAWTGIYSKPPGKPQLRKDDYVIRPIRKDVKGLLFETNDTMHGRMRRNFSHAFSDKSMREQAPIVTGYVDVLVRRLHESSASPVNIAGWLGFTMFDIIGDLVFGESFDCLQTSNLHWWVQLLFDNAVTVALYAYLQKFGSIAQIINFLIPAPMMKAEKAHTEMTIRTLNRRLARKEPRPDFVTHVQKTLNTPTGITIDELLETSRVLIFAGAETTATLLTGLLYLVLSSPRVYHQLVSETRLAFKTKEEINVQSVQCLGYQLAVINETFRLFPPVPSIPRRITPGEGCVIAGHHVPGDTLVAVDLWAVGHSSANFHRCREFVPERWLPASHTTITTPDTAPDTVLLSPFSTSVNNTRPVEFDNDKRKAIQPFSVGPRNCIGKNLAYAEIRLILARLLWEFDFELEERSRDWMEGLRVWGFFEKGTGLWVRLRAVER